MATWFVFGGQTADPAFQHLTPGPHEAKTARVSAGGQKVSSERRTHRPPTRPGPRAPSFMTSPVAEAPVIAIDGIGAAVAALYPSLDLHLSQDFDSQGRLTEDAKSQKCGLIVSALETWEQDESEQDICGVGHLAIAGWMDAARERGCIDDATWGAFYQRLHARRVEAQYGFHVATIGTSLTEQCGGDAWGDADLNEKHACEALAHQSGTPLMSGVCSDTSELTDDALLMTDTNL